MGDMIKSIRWEGEFAYGHFLILNYPSKCERIHGHNAKVIVEIEGLPNEEGMVMDYNHIHKIIDELDHRMLVPDVAIDKEDEEFYYITTHRGSKLILHKDEVVVIPQNTTSENISEFIMNRLAENAHDGIVHIKVTVYEDPRSYATSEVFFVGGDE